MMRQDERDRLLAGGRPSGPELDALWSKVSAALPAEKPSLAARLFRWSAVLVPLAAATAAFIFMPGKTLPTQETFTARGTGETPTLPQLAPSCGSAATPCAVGKPVFLKVTDVPGAGMAYVALVADGKASWLVDGEPVNSVASALHVKVVPEPSDVAGGITLRLWLAREPLSPEARASLLAGTRLDPFSTLTLAVVP
jgi:hypothetical protein